MKDEPEELNAQIAALRREIERLNGQRFFRLQNSLPRLLAFSFARGLALGLGSVIGATILVSLLGLFLTKIDFVPIIGGWAREIADQMSSANP